MNIKEIIKEVIYGVVPIFVIITILEFTLVRLPMETYLNFIFGTILIIIGMFLFLIGIEIGFVPFGKELGSSLIKSGKVRIILVVGFIVGFALTLPEPDVQVLIDQLNGISTNFNTLWILLVISLGVGIFVLLALLRILLKVYIKYLLMGSFLIIFILMPFVPKEYIGIAFDSGGATTGALSVPFILSIGLGLSSMIASSKDSSDSFGILGLASIGPIMALMILGVIL